MLRFTRDPSEQASPYVMLVRRGFLIIYLHYIYIHTYIHTYSSYVSWMFFSSFDLSAVCRHSCYYCLYCCVCLRCVGIAEGTPAESCCCWWRSVRSTEQRWRNIQLLWRPSDRTTLGPSSVQWPLRQVYHLAVTHRRKGAHHLQQACMYYHQSKPSSLPLHTSSSIAALCFSCYAA